MKSSFLWISTFSIILSACSAKVNQNHEFVTLTTVFFEAYLTLNPETATYLGDHRFDHRLNDYTSGGYSAMVDLAKNYLDSLSLINPNQLSDNNRVDYLILENSLRYMVFQADTLREHTWNPLIYNAGGTIYPLMARNYAPVRDRLHAVKARLEQIPGMLDAARQNLERAPRVHTETAIRQNAGSLFQIRDEVDKMISEAPDLEGEVRPAQDAAMAAIENFGEWLKTDLLPRSDDNFRIGKDLFAKKLAYYLESELTAETILTSAESDLKKTQELMAETARELLKEWNRDIKFENESTLIRFVLDSLANHRPNGETIVDQAKADLEEINAFVRQKKIITLPEEPVKIIVMPEFQRGVAVAYCDSPGPLEKNAETFYAISPPPADWTPERIETHFREYNNFMLKNLTVHEAVPGHYLQLAHSNKYRGETLIRSVFSSGPFVEGWATYAEQVMVENGYGGHAVKMQQLKMKLRLIINAMIDQKIHAGGMTREEALALMMNEGFQEEAEAIGKWTRACLTSAQLSTYYVGNLEVNDIRKQWIRNFGEIKDQQAFHDKVISFGSPAPKYVKVLMGI